MRFLAVVAVVAACKNDKPAKQAPKPAEPPVADVPAIVAKTGPAELLPSDGAPFLPFTIEQYAKEFAGSKAVVVATQFPTTLSSTAGAGVNLFAKGRNVSWYVDGDPEHGFLLAYDENLDGDLRNDPVLLFAHTGDTWELALTLQMPPAEGDTPVAAPVRIRFKGGEFHIQEALQRRGTLQLPGGLMPFVLLGSGGQFGQDPQFVAFDLDRNGSIDLDNLDNAELFSVFEKNVTIDDTSYAFEIPTDGSELILRPLATKLPPRPALATGTTAPDVAVTDLDGKHATLASLKGQLVLLDFWDTSCGPCVKALPHLAELRAQYHDKGFELMAIAAQSEDVRETLGDHRAGIEAMDEAAHTLYRIDRYPSYFLVGRDGNFLCTHCKLDRVEELLAEQLR